MTGRGPDPCQNAPDGNDEQEATMDYHSLVAANFPAKGRPAKTDARAEDRYYRDQIALPRPGLRALVSVATAAGLILLIDVVAQA
jgi:hypothetical protein